ncbi:alpha/beta hydrolase [Tahibacter amnicola]|uniref:Alpha/beta hydrolase-fold protein n=1 Tax=Tahibacter amnicola TaxID=2976241 RepID=A0ABY6BCX0_9GAMM|nr:alpha/beta hydrolase-fold protein [Tahibacter amnicola]UXI67584.1 alpha/beta hydrolase-fold protein [Tahibacter amnicola]
MSLFQRAARLLFAGLALTLSTAGIAGEALPPATQLQQFTVESRAVAETRRINVYIPDTYAADTTLRLPVLYMPDGGLQEDFPHVASTLHTAIGSGAMRPFLLVGIENTQRRRDLTPPTQVEADRKIAPQVGGSAAFRQFIRDELMPQVSTRYRTTPETAIIGESLAGLFIVETLLHEPRLFDTYIALDPSLWWNAKALPLQAKEALARHALTGRTVYLTTSQEPGIVEGTAMLAEVLGHLDTAGLRSTYRPRTDLRHDNIYRTMAPVILRAVFPPMSTPAPTQAPELARPMHAP